MIKKITLLLITFGLTACSQRAQDISDTLNEAIFGFDDVTLSKEQINALPYASAYVRINDGPQIFMVLGYADTTTNGDTELKWVSSDNAMIVTINGRITKTLNLPHNNLSAINFSLDEQPQISQTKAWTASYDWQEDYQFGYKALATLTKLKPEQISSPLWKIEAEKWKEEVRFSSINQSLTNYYWLNANKKVIQTIQHLGPSMSKIEITFLKRYGE